MEYLAIDNPQKEINISHADEKGRILFGKASCEITGRIFQAIRSGEISSKVIPKTKYTLEQNKRQIGLIVSFDTHKNGQSIIVKHCRRN